MRRTDIDIHDLGPGLIKEAGIPIPAEVGDSHFPSVDELDNYPDEDFALVMLDGDEKLRKYACMSPGTAYLNTLCLLGAWDRLPKTAAVLAGTNLMTILEGTSTPAPLELVEKVASAVHGDFRHEGDLVDFGGNLIVDITDLSEEKKANLLSMAGKGFKAIGTGIKNTWQSARTAPQAAGKSQLSSSLKDGYNYAKGGIQQGIKQMRGAKNHFQTANRVYAKRGAQGANVLGGQAPSATARWGAAAQNTAGKARHAAGSDLLAAGAATAGAAGVAGGVAGGGYMMGRRKQASAKALLAVGAAGVAGGAAVGHSKGKKKGRVQGFAAGYGSGSQKGYWKGRQHGHQLSQRNRMVRRLQELEGQQKKTAQEMFKEALSPELKARARAEAERRKAELKTVAKDTATAPADKTKALSAYKRRARQSAVFEGKGRSGGVANAKNVAGAAGAKGIEQASGITKAPVKAVVAPAVAPAAAPAAAKAPAAAAATSAAPSAGRGFLRSGLGRAGMVGAGVAALGGGAYLAGKRLNKQAEAVPLHLLRDQYPVQNPVQIKQAEAFFDEHWRRMHPSDRRTYSVNLVKAAVAYDVGLTSPTLEKYAGNAISTEAVLHLNARTRYMDDHGREMLVKLAETIPVADPDHFADALTQIDEHYGISQKWDTHVVDPYAAVITKQADAAYYKWSEGPDTVNEDQLIAACKEKRIPLTSALGEDGYQELSKAPVVVFQSLPDDLKHVISRIAA